MKHITIIIGIIIFFTGCKKYRDLTDVDDLNGNRFYSGQLLFSNNLDSAGIPYPIGGVHLQLYKANEAVNYLFDSTTDNLGYFAFRNLKNETYRIHASRVIGNVLFESDREFTVQGADFIDTPWIIKPNETKQNGIAYTIKDHAGGYMNGTKIFLYSSQSIADADTNFEGIGASVTLPPTNGYGKTYRLNIPALPFYVIKIKTLTNLTKTVVLNNGIPQYGIIPLEESF